MTDRWLKFGCFLTGYKYDLVKHSSLATAKAVYKYTSAILLVSLLWCFIGYYFSQRYLKTGIPGSIAGAIILAFAVIQIERQIILTFGGNKKVIQFRIGLAFVMAIMGSIIVDQMMFAQDIEKRKISSVDDEVLEILPKRTSQLSEQLRGIDTSIKVKEKERVDLVAELTKSPNLTYFTTSTTTRRDSSGKSIGTDQQVIQNSIANPKFNQLKPLDDQIKELNEQKFEKENKKVNMQQELTKEISDKRGFFDELKLFFDLLFSSWIIVFVWLLFLLFFLFIELLVVFSKLGDLKNDYEYMLMHQMNTRIDQLKAIGSEQS